MTDRTLARDVDWKRVFALALDGAQRLRLKQPATASRLLYAIEAMGGAAVHVARWHDDEAAIAVAGVEVWRGPLAAVMRDGSALN